MTHFRYEDSHPWIDFKFSVDQNPLWAKLGEAFSKNQHLAGIPLQPAFAAHLSAIVLTKGALATAAIEGNTLSEADASEILNEGRNLPPSQEYLEQEIRNIARALRDIDESGRNVEDFELTPDWLKDQNRKVLSGLEVPDGVKPGEYTSHQLVVGNVYKAAPPENVPMLVEMMCEWINREYLRPSQDTSLPADLRFYHAFFGSVLAHLYTAWIHPFGDGNGRTARLLEVAILSHSGVVPWVASNLMSDHYNRTRSRYYARLAAASRNRDVHGFVSYAAEGYVDMLREQIDAVRGNQMQVAWINFVHQAFTDETSGKTKDRRRELVLALSRVAPATKKEARRLTPELAEMYAGHEERMVSRDLNALMRMGLVRKVDGSRFAARIEIMHAFIPLPNEERSL